MAVALYSLILGALERNPSVPVTGLTGHLASRNTLTASEKELAQTPILALPPLLSDKDLADILAMTTAWVRSHAREILASRGLAAISDSATSTLSIGLAAWIACSRRKGAPVC
jgi:hypothetical protein